MKSSKYLFVIFYVFLLTGCIVSRDRQYLSPASKGFLNWYFKDHKKVVYVDNLNERLVGQLTTLLMKDTLKDASYGLERSIILTDVEKIQLREAVEMLAINLPKNGIFAEGIVIEPDTIFKKREPQEHLKAWDMFYNTYGKGYYSFSRPIFLRKGNLAIFFAQFNCGILCSQGELAVYRKNRQNWEKWIVINNWTS